MRIVASVRGISGQQVKLLLQPRLDRAQQPEAHLAVVALERDHEADPPMA